MTAIEWTSKAVELLESLDRETQERVVTKLDEASEWTDRRHVDGPATGRAACPPVRGWPRPVGRRPPAGRSSRDRGRTARRPPRGRPASRPAGRRAGGRRRRPRGCWTRVLPEGSHCSIRHYYFSRA